MSRSLNRSRRRSEYNPLKWDEIVASFGRRQMIAAVAVPIVFTVLAEIVTFALTGRATNGGRSGLVVPWLLVGSLCATLFAARRRVLAAKERRIPLVMWISGVNQILWLAALAWYSVPVFSIVLAVGLCASTFNDARYCYNAPFLHLYYLLVWPGFFAFLLIIDWCGGEGLLARATSDPRYLQTAVPIVIAVMFILQIVVSIIGAQWRELDAKLSAHGRLQAQLAEMRREREVIGRSCDFLVQGLAAGRFSHDVASPVSTVALSARELLDGLHDLEALAQSGKGGEPRSLALFAELRAAAERIQRGQARIAEMATTMASSLRGDSSASGTTSEALIEAASREHRAALERHRARYLEPVVEVAPSTLYLSAEHAAAIGSLLCNGSLQNPNARVRISGHVVNDWFYVIGIRDFGVDGDDRIQALQKVRRRLAFTDTQDVEAAESRSYEGLGLGLVLAKILFLRHNGCLSVASPQQGPGLLFVVVLPRRPLADIPIPDNDPEAVAERWATLLAGTMAPIESGSEPRTSSRAREDQPVVERA